MLNIILAQLSQPYSYSYAFVALKHEKLAKPLIHFYGILCEQAAWPTIVTEVCKSNISMDIW